MTQTADSQSSVSNDSINQFVLTISYRGEEVSMQTPVVGVSSDVNPNTNEEALLFGQAEVLIQETMKTLSKRLIEKGILQ